jgi:chromate reductase, NAD(P)H dehydrogenase (quinone)
LRACAENLPDGVNMEIYVPSDLPIFNQDYEAEDRTTPSLTSVTEFREKVASADAVLFSVCEYNYGLSAAMKNALDWASRGPSGNAFNDKPAAVIGAG